MSNTTTLNRKNISTKLNELKKIKQEKTDALFNECGVFFAFSNEQFANNKTPLKDGDKYVNFMSGGYVPKSNLDALISKFDAINEEFEQAMQDKELREAQILYQLLNHECYYTGDIEDTLSALGSGYTEAEVWAVYNKNRHLAEEW